MVFLEVNKRDCPNVLYQELWMSKKKMPHMIFQNGSNGHDRQQTEILERYLKIFVLRNGHFLLSRNLKS